MMRFRLLSVSSVLLATFVFASPCIAVARVGNRLPTKQAPIVASHVGSASGVHNAPSEELPLLGLGAALILGASLMRRMVSAGK